MMENYGYRLVEASPSPSRQKSGASLIGKSNTHHFILSLGMMNSLSIGASQGGFVDSRRKREDEDTEALLERHLEKGDSDVIVLWQDFFMAVVKFLVQRSNSSLHLNSIEKDFKPFSLSILVMKKNIAQVTLMFYFSTHHSIISFNMQTYYVFNKFLPYSRQQKLGIFNLVTYVWLSIL